MKIGLRLQDAKVWRREKRENPNPTDVVTVIAGIVGTEIGRSGPKSACEEQAERRLEMKCNADVMRNLILMVVMVFVVSANSVEAAEIELSVATDEPSYSLGEDITVSVTAYNPNDYEVTLQFGDTLQASYIMDNVYDWSSDKIFLQVLTEVTIGAVSSYNWDLDHDWEYTVGPSTYGYDLSIGTHSVVGALQEQIGEPPGNYTYYSQPLEFEVVPEPATLGLVLLGRLILLRRRYWLA